MNSNFVLELTLLVLYGAGIGISEANVIPPPSPSPSPSSKQETVTDGPKTTELPHVQLRDLIANHVKGSYLCAVHISDANNKKSNNNTKQQEDDIDCYSLKELIQKIQEALQKRKCLTGMPTGNCAEAQTELERALAAQNSADNFKNP
jgi:hypothetical protein